MRHPSPSQECELALSLVMLRESCRTDNKVTNCRCLSHSEGYRGHQLIQELYSTGFGPCLALGSKPPSQQPKGDLGITGMVHTGLHGRKLIHPGMPRVDAILSSSYCFLRSHPTGKMARTTGHRLKSTPKYLEDARIVTAKLWCPRFISRDPH
jgi:hypothetical protein